MFCQLLDDCVFNILLAYLTIKYCQMFNMEPCGCKFGICVQVSRKEKKRSIQIRQNFSLAVRFVLSFSTILLDFPLRKFIALCCKVFSYLSVCDHCCISFSWSYQYFLLCGCLFSVELLSF